MGHTRTGFLFSLLIVLAVASAFAGDAAACTCVDWPADRRMTEADRVFIGRAGKRVLVGEEEVLHFSVLQALKGEAPSELELRRRPDLSCERSFQVGELALVFVVKGRIRICNGNIDIDKLMPTLGDYLAHGERDAGPPSEAAIKLGLAGRLGGGKKVSVYFPPLAGKSISVGATRVTFIAARSDEVPVLSANTHGSLTYLSLRRPDGTAAAILVGRDHGRLALIYALERDLKLR